MSELLTYLRQVKFDNQLKNLKRRLKNKTVIVYGAGLLFQEIVQNYDLSRLTIIGISDKKYKLEDEGKTNCGYKIIPCSKLSDYNPDYVLVATLKFVGLLQEIKKEYYKDKKTKVFPLVDKPFVELFKEILHSM